MKKHHLTILRERHKQIGAHNVNVNEVHVESLSLNDKIACWVSDHVGTMWFCYGLAALMFVWGAINVLLGKHAFDPYPYSFLFFCLGGIMQSLLMPLIMVAQNQSSRHAELRAEADYHVNQASFEKLEVIVQYISNQTELIRQQDEKIAQEVLKSETHLLTQLDLYMAEQNDKLDFQASLIKSLLEPKKPTRKKAEVKSAPTTVQVAE